MTTQIKVNRTVYTTGAFLRPQKVKNSLGNIIWMWTVVEFTDDSYNEDGNICNPFETAASYEKLIINSDRDDNSSL